MVGSGSAGRNSPASTFFPPLVAATYARYADVVRKLLNRGASVFEADCKRNTALHAAAATIGSDDILILLLEKVNTISFVGLKDKTNLLIDAINGDNANGLNILLDWRVASGHETELNVDAALYHTALHGKDGYLKILLQRGADPNASSPLGLHRTALRAAVHSSRYNNVLGCIRLLLEAGADIHAMDNGDSILQDAASIGDEATVRLLLQHEASTEQDGGSIGHAITPAITRAMDKGHVGVVRLLVDTWAEGIEKDKEGRKRRAEEIS